MGKSDLLTLSDAIERDRIAEFVSQETKRGIGPALERDFDNAMGEVIKPHRSKDRTSRSPSPGGSRGK